MSTHKLPIIGVGCVTVMKIYGINGEMNLVGKRVRQARMKEGLSQTELAARLQVLGISVEQKAISRVELGTRLVPDYEIPALAAALHVSVVWLLTGEDCV